MHCGASSTGRAAGAVRNPVEYRGWQAAGAFGGPSASIRSSSWSTRSAPHPLPRMSSKTGGNVVGRVVITASSRQPQKKEPDQGAGLGSLELSHTKAPAQGGKAGSPEGNTRIITEKFRPSGLPTWHLPTPDIQFTFGRSNAPASALQGLPARWLRTRPTNLSGPRSKPRASGPSLSFASLNPPWWDSDIRGASYRRCNSPTVRPWASTDPGMRPNDPP